MRRVLAPFAADRRGATAVEFALLGPVFLMCLFGIIEGARMLWINQALNEAAYSTVRCRSIGAASCSTNVKQVEYAINRARLNGVAISQNNVVIQGNAVCRGISGSAQVTIQRAFNSPVAGLLIFPATVSGRACFPPL